MFDPNIFILIFGPEYHIHHTLGEIEFGLVQFESLFNKPRVAGAVLEAPSLLVNLHTNLLSHPLPKIYLKHSMFKWLEIGK